MLRKALVDKLTGTVIGIIEISEKGFGKLTAGKDQLYWDCTRYAVQPGDLFVDGVFYTQADPSVQVEYIPTTEEKLTQTNTNVTSLEDAVTGLMDMMVMGGV